MSQRRLPLILSLLFHAILLLGLFSLADRTGKKEEAFVVELVSFDSGDSIASTSSGNSIGPPAAVPAPPVSSVRPKRPSLLHAKGDSPRFDASSKVVAEAASPSESQEQKALLSEAPGDLSQIAPPAPINTEAAPVTAELESAVRLVAEGRSSNPGSDEGMGRADSGSSGGGGPGPTVSDALPGGIAGVGGSGGAPRFIMPRSDGRSHPKPRYPEAARAEGREGTALLKVMILPTGAVGEAVVERSSGHPDLDQAAVDAVMKWTFLPARRGETPVSASIRIPVTFSLDRP